VTESEATSGRPDWTPPAGSIRHEIFGIAATTAPLASRGIYLARVALERTVEDFEPYPIRIEHGVERQGTVLRVWLEDGEDEITELHYQGEVFLPAGVDPRGAVPRGMSISLIETERHTDDTAIVVGADSMTFDDDALGEMRQMLEAAPIEIVVERQHQFAALPPPLIVLVFQQAAIPLLQGLAASAIWDLMKGAVRRLLSRSKQPDLQCRLSVRVPGAAEVNILLPMNADDSVEALDTVFRGVADIVRAGASGVPSQPAD
jgi:hypothetical protein